MSRKKRSTGAAVAEFRQLGFDMNESKERFAEAVQIVKLALTHEKFSFEGQHYKMEDITMRPRPRDPQQLINDFHFSWGSPQSAPATITAAAPSPNNPEEIRLAIEMSSRCNVSEQSSTDSTTAT